MISLTWYKNRRLYSEKEKSTYSHEEILEALTKGKNIQVLSKDGEDLTDWVLSKIMLEEIRKRKVPGLPSEFLSFWLRAGKLDREHFEVLLKKLIHFQRGIEVDLQHLFSKNRGN